MCAKCFFIWYKIVFRNPKDLKIYANVTQLMFFFLLCVTFFTSILVHILSSYSNKKWSQINFLDYKHIPFNYLYFFSVSF